jgi:hypothetical protein
LLKHKGFSARSRPSSLRELKKQIYLSLAVHEQQKAAAEEAGASGV